MLLTSANYKRLQGHKNTEQEHELTELPSCKQIIFFQQALSIYHSIKRLWCLVHRYLAGLPDTRGVLWIVLDRGLPLGL